MAVNHCMRVAPSQNTKSSTRPNFIVALSDSLRGLSAAHAKADQANTKQRERIDFRGMPYPCIRAMHHICTESQAYSPARSFFF
jgi:hypothetical protein